MTNKNIGDTVDAIPAPKRPQKYDINWDHHANMAYLTGKPVLAGKHIRLSQVSALRQYTRSPFRETIGHIAIAMRNSSVESDGIRYGDVYFTWVYNISTDATLRN